MHLSSTEGALGYIEYMFPKRRAAGKKGGRGRPIGRAKAGLNTKLHAIADAEGRR